MVLSEFSINFLILNGMFLIPFLDFTHNFGVKEKKIFFEYAISKILSLCYFQTVDKDDMGFDVTLSISVKKLQGVPKFDHYKC